MIGRPRTDVPVVELAERYNNGESTMLLAEAFGVSRWLVRRRLVAAGVKMRESACPRRPGGPLHLVNGYLGSFDREGRHSRVHRACWEAYNGPIPGGLVIHHIDGDKRNNEAANLACLSHAEHRQLHVRAKCRAEGH